MVNKKRNLFLGSSHFLSRGENAGNQVGRNPKNKQNKKTKTPTQKGGTLKPSDRRGLTIGHLKRFGRERKKKYKKYKEEK